VRRQSLCHDLLPDWQHADRPDLRLYGRSEGATLSEVTCTTERISQRWQAFYVSVNFINGRIWSLTQNGQGKWVTTLLVNAGGGDLAGFGQDANGELYVARYSSGAVARLHQVGTP